MIWEVQAAIMALAELGQHDVLLELEGIHAGLARDCGTDGSPSDDWRRRFEGALANAHRTAGAAADDVVLRGRAVPATERAARVAALIEQATAAIA